VNTDYVFAGDYSRFEWASEFLDLKRRLEEQAKTMAPGKDREMLLRKAGQTKTAAHINEWLSSPGLMSPK
jgi:hypothetical protein